MGTIAEVIYQIVFWSGGMALGYLSGHATCMHQHASTEEADKLLRDETGKINALKYIKEAFKDFKRMQDDPLGLKKA